MFGGFEVQPMERHENTARKKERGIWDSDSESERNWTNTWVGGKYRYKKVTMSEKKGAM